MYAGFDEVLDLEAVVQQERIASARTSSEGVTSFMRSGRLGSREDEPRVEVRTPAMNLAGILAESAAVNPDHAAIKLDEMELSYGAARTRRARRVARLLRERGVEPGDRVG